MNYMDTCAIYRWVKYVIYRQFTMKCERSSDLNVTREAQIDLDSDYLESTDSSYCLAFWLSLHEIDMENVSISHRPSSCVKNCWVRSTISRHNLLCISSSD